MSCFDNRQTTKNKNFDRYLPRPRIKCGSVFRKYSSMSKVSKTGLQACLTHKQIIRPVDINSLKLDVKCEVSPAPYILRPYAGLYNPFPTACSVLCNHPAQTDARDYLKRAKDSRGIEDKLGHIPEEQDDRTRVPHDIVTEDMFRRYTETDSRPLTPAPTLASGKSRGSRRCLTPDQPYPRTAIVLDLRRSHSQETLYYHGYSTSEVDRSTLPSLNLSEGAHNRLLKGQTEQLPPLASPLVLAKRAPAGKEPGTGRKNQLKALNIGKSKSKPAKGAATASQSQRSKEKEANDESDGGLNCLVDDAASGESRRRGKRRRKGRAGGSDRMASAGLAAHTQQDPETQIAGITSDSHNASSRGSIAAPIIDDVIAPPPIKAPTRPKTDSFLDDDILKLLHRDVDEEAIETEFDTKRRYVLEEALRTRPPRAAGEEMQTLLKELKVPEVSLGDWLHIPRVFSRQNAHFTLPLDSKSLMSLSPMQYTARFVTLKKSKQLLYLTVLRKFRQIGYRMPKKDIPVGLTLMMGGVLTKQQVVDFQVIMEWDSYEEEEVIPDEIKLTLSETGYQRPGCFRPESNGGGDTYEPEANTIKYRTWCGLCAVCERMYGKFPPRNKDPPDGMELSDFTMIETKLATLQVHKGLAEILNAIRTR